MSFIDGLTHSLNLTNTLSQVVTNGLSVLGTLDAPYLPKYLSQIPLIGYPWGNRNVSNTNPFEEYPDTGVVRTYDFTVSRGKLAPDGVEKNVMLINGAFPGPLIEANWGDTIQVTVHNNLGEEEEGTSMHWHGLTQKESQWFDGVPGVTQCPIAPNKKMTYSFKADMYGTSWYHSHYSAQYADGIFGPMVIYGPSALPYDIDIGPVMLHDHYHSDYYSLVQGIMTPVTGVLPPPSNNNLINGKMNADCSAVLAPLTCRSNAGLSKFKFEKGKVHRLRLINSGAEGIQKFSIDGHTMKVIANDFVPVKPYDTNVVTLGIGQRTDVLVTANGERTDAVWMRSQINLPCGVSLQGTSLAAIYYDDADTNKAPTTSLPQVFNPIACQNDDLLTTEPYYEFGAQPEPETVETINIDFAVNATGHALFFMDGSSFRVNYDHPVLLLSNAGNNSYPHDPQWNVYNFGSNSSIRIVINNRFPLSHPMHLHGHNFFVLAEGLGVWDGIVRRPNNPQRRDVQLVQGLGYIVLQINADNPGVWPLHCHIAWHVSSGLYVNVVERPDDIRDLAIPESVRQGCRDWWDFSGTEYVNQIDSGLRRPRREIKL
ncbi:multicopper oxidase [Patellaria atrata CBS 101060]|uniref:Multicopper oxidase n=1 Tax=Patellaria atrata CBS 101060 TaxID=1346257 RepID=A0A9P4SAG5_9PEZI|nr:multicopper oxidase [Patellaria atrata CBS 101060]